MYWMAIKPIHIFGVRHTTYLEDGPTKDVSELVRKWGPLGVKKLGIEFSSSGTGKMSAGEPPKWWKKSKLDWIAKFKYENSAERYARAVELHAERKGMPVFSLERPTDPSIILHHVLKDISSLSMRGTTVTHAINLSLIFSREAYRLNRDASLAPIYVRRLGMLEAIAARPELHSWEQIGKLDDAIAVRRSIDMYKRASLLGLNHIVLGGAHAEDCKLIFGAPVIHINRREKMVDASKRLAAYDKLSQTLQQILRAAH